MDSDRGAALIKQAAFRGLIDFSKADPSDRWWWLKLKWLLNELEEDNFRSAIKTHFHLNTALLSYQNEEKQFKHHWDRAVTLSDGLHDSLFPYAKIKKDPNSQQNEYKRLITSWKDTFGDPDDPLIKAEIQKTVDFLTGKTQPNAIRLPVRQTKPIPRRAVKT